MSVTYPADPLKPYGERAEVTPFGDVMPRNPRLDGANEEPFVPVYARRGKAARRGGGKMPTWMILAPVGVLVLGGLGAMMLMNGEETAGPLAEPAATAPVVSATPLVAAATSAASASTPAPVVPASAPVLREATPVRRAAAPAPARRATTPATPRAAAAPVARTATPPPAASSTSTLNTAPTSPAPIATATPAPAQPPAPVIVVQPLG